MNSNFKEVDINEAYHRSNNNNKNSNKSSFNDDIETDSITKSSVVFETDLVDASTDEYFSRKDNLETRVMKSEYDDLNRGQKIQSIIVENSKDITFGNKNFYQGPITINQFLKEKEVNQKDAKNNKKADKILYTFVIHNKSITITRKILYIFSGVGLLICLILAASICAIVLNTSELNKDDDSNHMEPRLITKDEWGGLPPIGSITKLELPAKRIIIAHTVGESCKYESTCKFRVQTIQNSSLANNKDFNDIPYNFLIGGDGNVYEGRGWHNISAVVPQFNQGSLCLGFIGTFTKVAPSKKQLNAGQWFIEEALSLKRLIESYRLYGARVLMSTDSPGDALYEIIKNWPHFSEKI